MKALNRMRIPPVLPAMLPLAARVADAATLGGQIKGPVRQGRGAICPSRLGAAPGRKLSPVLLQ